MSNSVDSANFTPLQSLMRDYLGVLANERGASEHTLRAYRRELNGFAAFISGQYGDEQPVSRIEHTHIRAYLATLYDRGLSNASAARALAAGRGRVQWVGRAGGGGAESACPGGTPQT